MHIKELLWKPYFVAKANWFIWSTIMNREARRLHSQHPPQLNQTQEKILEKLRRDGISVTTLEELFPDRAFLEGFITFAKSLEGGAESISKKQFLKYYWTTTAPLDLINPFVQFALDPTIINIANSYMGMWSSFKHYTLNLTVPVPKDEVAVQSQRWHRDPQEKKMLKVFIYLNDVDTGAGPFTYAIGSTYGNKYGNLFPQKPPQGVYPPEGAVETAVKPDDIKVMTGSAGSVIFCDTAGLHRGGYATERERLMFTAFFSAPSYKDPKWYKENGVLESDLGKSLTPAARYAVRS